jgi:hypothetical protein
MPDKTLKFDFMRLPGLFLGLIIGIVFGGIAGIIFEDIGFVSGVPWEEIFIFLGALFGALVGYKADY